MFVHRSNRVERLVDVLAELVATPLADPFARECIVVQGRGMERWLAMELARRLGVWANPDFPFPRRVIEQAAAAVVGPDAAPAASFAPEALRWAIAALLPGLVGRPGFAPIARYLDGDRDGARRLQLAARIADCFDRYAVYRPALLQRWDTAPGDDWQATLWRALLERSGRAHLAARVNALLAAAEPGRVREGGLPQRISLFGISTLPPLYVEALAALAAHVELHLFILSPSREYWAHLRDRREQVRDLRRQAVGGSGAEAPLAIDDGHPLLAALGRLGRDFQHVLESRVDYHEPDDDLYEDPLTASASPPTLLAALQSDLLHLTPGAAMLHGGLAPDDESIRVHACHGPMREAEVLLDQLTALFEEDDTLAPHDVVVMTPSIETYAPVIEAVFGAGEGAPRIPYRIADRHVRATSEVADAFAAVLAALRGRLSAPEVLDLLRREPLRARYGIAGDDVEVVRRWVVESGVRWGVDAADRRQAGQPDTAQNTWRFGLDRLLLGYAAPGHERALFGGVLPYDDVEGGEAALLGKLAELCAALFAGHVEIQAPRSAAAWRDVLGRVLDATVARTPQNAYEHQQVRAALAALADRAAAAGFDEPIALESLQAELDDELQRGATAHGFLGGGVTFCELLPMRAIPFRVVCLLGMNDDAFPRHRRPPGFDLIARHPRVGDRSARDDDRYLFLEAVLSARHRLIITYVGQRITDNTELPPSVVVSDLLDALDRTCGSDDSHAAAVPVGHQYALDLGAAVTGALVTGSPAHPPRPPRRASRPRSQGHVSTSATRHVSTARQHILIRHPLQPFSPRYFRDPADRRLFSYAASYCAGAAALAGDRRTARFVAAPLVVPAATERRVDVDLLARFFEHPSRAFLLRRLGIALGHELEPVEAREPLVLDALERWTVGDRVLRQTLDGQPRDVVAAALHASGTLPLGALGRCTAADLRPEVDAVARAATAAGAGELAPFEIDAVIGGTRVTGVLRGLSSAGLRRVQFSRPRRRGEVGMWIRHVLLNWAAPSGVMPASLLIARPDKPDRDAVRVAYAPVADAATLLTVLLDLYWGGQAVPVPLFERASRAYAAALRDEPNDAAAALAAARKEWSGDALGHRRGDLDDPYVSQLYAETDPLAPDFELCAGWRGFAAVAVEVLGPLLSHRTEDA